MAKKISAGFTLIELMLFLAITGLMMLGIFAAGNNAINNQRYSTAVSGVQDFMQGQFNSVVNVRNDRTTGACTASGIVNDATGSDAQPIGQSNCTVIGRYIAVASEGADAGKKLSTSPVYATNDITTESFDSDSTDVAALQAAQLKAGDVTDTYTLTWDTKLVQAGSETTDSFGILIYRSPLSGRVGMLWRRGTDTTIGNILDSASSEVLKMCVSQSGWTSIGAMGVALDPKTSGSSGVVSRITPGAGC